MISLRLPPAKALVAVSGGPDSVALLDLLVRSAPYHGLELCVAHVDHGIHPHSARVAAAVRKLADRFGLPYEAVQLKLGPGIGETAARAERYAWLDATRRDFGAEYVFTAHHADDQVETVLMRVLHGSGPAGLAGMMARRGAVVRPLLPFRRSELLAYVQASGLPVWQDPANADPRHLRSWTRAELLPALRRRVPDVDRNLERLASQAARDRAAWDVVLRELEGVGFRVEPDGASLALDWLASASPPLGEALMLAAARRVGCRVGPVRLGRVGAVLRGGSGAFVPLGGGWRAERSFDRLYFVAPPAPSTAGAWAIEGEKGEGWWGRWHFRWAREPAPERQSREGYVAWVAPGRCVVRAWAPGQRVRPLAGRGERAVARCLQEKRIPRWRRAEWPVVAQVDPPGDIVWVPGVCRSDALVADAGGEALRLEAEYI